MRRRDRADMKSVEPARPEPSKGRKRKRTGPKVPKTNQTDCEIEETDAKDNSERNDGEGAEDGDGEGGLRETPLEDHSRKRIRHSR